MYIIKETARGSSSNSKEIINGSNSNCTLQTTRSIAPGPQPPKIMLLPRQPRKVLGIGLRIDQNPNNL
jgi:hypothetical protein